MKFRSGKHTQFNITNITKWTFAADVFFWGWNRPWKMIHISLRKKTLVAWEHKRRNICNFSRTDFCCCLLKWRKSEKEVIYRKKNRCHRAFKRVKSLRSSQNNGIFALSHHCVTFPRRPGYTAIPWCHTLSCSILVENVCAFSIVFTFVVCDAWCVRDMREKVCHSNGRECP